MGLLRAAKAFGTAYSKAAKSVKEEAAAQEALEREIDAVKIESPFLLTWTGFFVVMGLLALLLLATARAESGLPSLIFAVVWLFYVSSFPSRRTRLKRKILEARKDAMKEPSSN